MVTIGLALAGLVAGMSTQWVPVRWQGGPLEVLRRPVDPAAREAIRDWYRPETLDLLKGTPFNCVLVTWAAGLDAATEKEQRRMVAAYAIAAHARGIAVVGVAYGGASGAQAAEAKLDGVVAEEQLPGGGVAPRVRAVSDADRAAATPTTEPWIDSNLWLYQVLRSRGAEPPWLGHRLGQASPRDVLRAIDEAGAAGGRWVVELDDALAAGLWRKQPEALARWSRMAEQARYFEDHPEWRGFREAGRLAIVEGADEEYQNLVTRRRIPYRLIGRAGLEPGKLRSFDAVLALDVAAPTTAERSALATFVKAGGTVVVGPQWGLPEGPRVAVYRDADPETVARDLVELIGRDRLPVRLFNVSSVLAAVREDASSGRLLVQLVNYASEDSGAVTVRVAGEYRRARLYSPGAAPVDVELDREGGSTEARIVGIPVSAALLFEKGQP